MSTGEIFAPGAMTVGCNYWASHAGTNMWHDWDEASVEADFRALSGHGVKVLRIFPLWSDFQPIEMLCGWAGTPREVRIREVPLEHTPEGKAGMDPEMVRRFGVVCDLAQKYSLRLVVGLLTGWMSGRLYIPRLLDGKNLLTDPTAIRWEMRFVRYMVKRFRSHPAIAAWDLGNECNCMGIVDSADEMYAWIGAISCAIRAEDSSRPVISGMHGTVPEGVQDPGDLGELCDYLCTHPYPLFTPYCGTDPLDHPKGMLHAAAESAMYADLSGKPCLVEEVGTLGAMLASDDTGGRYLRGMLYTVWAEDCRGLLWWCGFDQYHLHHAPYDWNAVERELGLLRIDRTPKPVMEEMEAFEKFAESACVRKLPRKICDAVCILTHGQDAWGVAFGAYLMAKRAGLDVRFAWCEEEIPEAPVYLLPCVKTDSAIRGTVMDALRRRVKAGATLYISMDDGLISRLSELTGLEIVSRMARTGAVPTTLEGVDMELNAGFRLNLRPVGAEILACEADGNAVWSHNRVGKGEVYFTQFPLERTMATEPGILETEKGKALGEVYRRVCADRTFRALKAEAEHVFLTEHILSRTRRAAVCVNLLPEKRDISLCTAPGWRIVSAEGIPGQTEEIPAGLRLDANAGALVTMEQI